MRELALFAGAGGGILGGILLGWRTVCAVEIDPFCIKSMSQRQSDGILEPFPIWDDVRTFDGKPWNGHVDIITGGFPCQDISAAGKGAGIEGERSGLWSEMARIIGEVRPRFALVENSPILTSRGLGRVLGDLASLGYDATWGVISAADAIWLGETPCIDHLRERMFILAYADCGVCDGRSEVEIREEEGGVAFDRGRAKAADAFGNGRETWGSESTGIERRSSSCKCCYEATDPPSFHAQRHNYGSWKKQFRGSGWWQSEPAVGRVAHGVAHRVDRLKAIGNGQVPAVVALAWEILSNV